MLALRIDGDAVDAAEFRLGGGAAVAREALVARPRERGDLAALQIELAHAIVPGVGDVQGAVRRDHKVVHAVELGLAGGAIVAAVPLLAGTGKRRQHALGIDLADTLTDHFAKVEVAVTIEIDREGRIDLGSPFAAGDDKAHRVRTSWKKSVPERQTSRQRGSAW